MIWPSCQRATVQKSTSKLFPVGGMLVPFASTMAHFMVPVNRAIELVQSPLAKSTLYGRLWTRYRESLEQLHALRAVISTVTHGSHDVP